MPALYITVSCLNLLITAMQFIQFVICNFYLIFILTQNKLKWLFLDLFLNHIIYLFIYFFIYLLTYIFITNEIKKTKKKYWMHVNLSYY
ncbi:hypothetical protein KUTeg_010653 [Tegillarca granosa]|uniref:Uncharacterized protein n=1 Tax=Tegillarca granosa TaxID=220873 RepID=A0ABQ9F330_TEGGR|nr:hypothetical protein KUTeg_010653 [Tegillarca granosa]